MPEIYITVTPEGVIQCDLASNYETHADDKAFFEFLRPQIKALHWVAGEFKVQDQEGGSHANKTA